MTIERLLRERGIAAPQMDRSEPQIVEWWDRASLMFARGASGEVRVYYGANRHPLNTFDRVELPALQQNPNVTRVMAIDPATGETSVLWSR
jgi:hypothetical protein